MRTYHVINVLTLIFFITVPVQSQPNKAPENSVSEIKAVAPSDVAKAKDSLLRLTNKELDEAIRKSTTIVNKQDELMALKDNRRKAEKEFLNAVSNYVANSGRVEKVVIIKKKTDIITQLREGEIFFIKDSACVKYRRPLFSKKKCTQWGNYSFSLEDKFGNIEKL